MGSATRSSSAASKAGYSQAKEKMNDAIESDNVKRAVDIGVTAALASQPNGPAKVPTYSYLKHTGTFLNEANKNGVEAGVKAAGKDVLASQVADHAAGMAVDGAQQAVTSQAENEVMKKGVAEANKNLAMPSENASKQTLAAVMTNGADALSTSGDDTDD